MYIHKHTWQCPNLPKYARKKDLNHRECPVATTAPLRREFLKHHSAKDDRRRTGSHKTFLLPLFPAKLKIRRSLSSLAQFTSLPSPRGMCRDPTLDAAIVSRFRLISWRSDSTCMDAVALLSLSHSAIVTVSMARWRLEDAITAGPYVESPRRMPKARLMCSSCACVYAYDSCRV